ncbi:phosphotransferase enzyme family protein [Ornithinimicrobium pekingense]|uniref:Aminoglycoside phosphotransferase domain-containing protein n=1 Tax=Ornithinimicrobium pekingense TaxID=384677 RepID=A0ABQ2FAB0_9MICO|nr:phosphotransferase [Ornithinimicrobium pekingense]GGK77025.1 hypothetical protein GCM10011509_27090 [Ornithinimicrobium pekingense]
MTAYVDLTDEDQAEALRPVALEAAARFGLDVSALEVLTHSYNTTFCVRTDEGRRVALRIGTNSTTAPAAVVAQQEWQVAIAEETEVLVPRPLRTTDGGWYAVVPSDALGREVLVTCASWLDGADVEQPDPSVARELGRTMALLHDHARTWRMPAGGQLRTLDTPLFGDEDRLAAVPGLAPDQVEVLQEARRRTEEAFDEAFAGTAPIPLHADLHGFNLKWHDERLAVFDFDDSGLAVPVLDLAISAFYLRKGDGTAEEAMLAGYADVAPLPQVGPDTFEAMVASRQLLLANDLLGSTTARWRGRASDYLRVSVERLAHWLRTGRFTHLLPAA